VTCRTATNSSIEIPMEATWRASAAGIPSTLVFRRGEATTHRVSIVPRVNPAPGVVLIELDDRIVQAVLEKEHRQSRVLIRPKGVPGNTTVVLGLSTAQGVEHLPVEVLVE